MHLSVLLPVTHLSGVGEQGKVDESMREMAAIEALKSEKSDKEVRRPHFELPSEVYTHSCYNSENSNS